MKYNFIDVVALLHSFGELIGGYLCLVFKAQLLGAKDNPATFYTRKLLHMEKLSVLKHTIKKLSCGSLSAIPY